MKKKTVLFIVIYLLIGKMLTVGIENKNPALISLMYFAVAAVDYETSFLFNEKESSALKTKEQFSSALVLLNEQKVLVALSWVIFLFGYALMLSVFTLIFLIAIIVKTLWLWVIVPFFTTIWKILLFLFG